MQMLDLCEMVVKKMFDGPCEASLDLRVRITAFL